MQKEVAMNKLIKDCVNFLMIVAFHIQYVVDMPRIICEYAYSPTQ